MRINLKIDNKELGDTHRVVILTSDDKGPCKHRFVDLGEEIDPFDTDEFSDHEVKRLVRALKGHDVAIYDLSPRDRHRSTAVDPSLPAAVRKVLAEHADVGEESDEDRVDGEVVEGTIVDCSFESSNLPEREETTRTTGERPCE